jgi:hypothetical protein
MNEFGKRPVLIGRIKLSTRVLEMRSEKLLRKTLLLAKCFWIKDNKDGRKIWIH